MKLSWSVTESKSTLRTEHSTITQAHKNILLHQVRKSTGHEVTILGQHFSVAKNATPKKRETITTSRHIGNQGSAHAQYTCMTQPKWQTAEWEI